MKRLLAAIFALWAGAVSCDFSAGRQFSLQEGDMFVDFPLYGGRSFSEYIGRGTYVLVYGWASWSSPSVDQLSRLEKVAAQLPAGRVVPLALALDDAPSAASPLIAGRAPSVPLAVCDATEPARLLDVDSLPFLMLFGPDGTLLKRDLRWGDLPKILRYIGGN